LFISAVYGLSVIRPIVKRETAPSRL
jgi:hypothetical protein